MFGKVAYGIFGIKMTRFRLPQLAEKSYLLIDVW